MIEVEGGEDVVLSKVVVDTGSQVLISRARMVKMKDVRVVREGQVVMTGLQEVKGELIEVGEGGLLKVERGLQVTIRKIRLNHGSLVILESKDVEINEIINEGMISVKDC